MLKAPLTRRRLPERRVKRGAGTVHVVLERSIAFRTCFENMVDIIG